jgi:hypothetical protein
VRTSNVAKYKNLQNNCLYIENKNNNKLYYFMYITYIFIVYYLCQQMHKILNYITNAPTCFGASAPSSGSFDISSAEVTQYVMLQYSIIMADAI